MAIEEQRVGAAAMGRRSFWDRNRERLTAFQLVLRGNPNMAIGLFILVLAVMLAAFAPFIATDAPKELFTEPRLQAPSREAYFGTDSVGRDVFSRTIYGSRLSLGIGASVTILTLIGGVVIGITAGYYKLADNVVMRFMDGLMAFSVIPAGDRACGAAGSEFSECGARAVGGGDAARGAYRAGVGSELTGAAVCGGGACCGGEAASNSGEAYLPESCRAADGAGDLRVRARHIG